MISNPTSNAENNLTTIATQNEFHRVKPFAKIKCSSLSLIEEPWVFREQAIDDIPHLVPNLLWQGCVGASDA